MEVMSVRIGSVNVGAILIPAADLRSANDVQALSFGGVVAKFGGDQVEDCATKLKAWAILDNDGEWKSDQSKRHSH